jgi:hypothetical protein
MAAAATSFEVDRRWGRTPRAAPTRLSARQQLLRSRAYRPSTRPAAVARRRLRSATSNDPPRRVDPHWPRMVDVGTFNFENFGIRCLGRETARPQFWLLADGCTVHKSDRTMNMKNIPGRPVVNDVDDGRGSNPLVCRLLAKSRIHAYPHWKRVVIPVARPPPTIIAIVTDSIWGTNNLCCRSNGATLLRLVMSPNVVR